MYIPPGKWKFFANGRQGDLEMFFDGSNHFTGSVLGHSIVGIWERSSGKISFTTTDGAAQVYKGSLVFPQSDGPLNAIYTLAGTYDDLAGTYGWFAQRGEVP